MIEPLESRLLLTAFPMVENNPPAPRIALTVALPNGTTFSADTDPAFGNQHFFDPALTDIVYQPDGKALIAGTTGGDFAVSRYASQGVLDTSFGASGKLSTTVSPAGHLRAAAFVLPDGSIHLLTLDADGTHTVLAYTADGILDLTYGQSSQISASRSLAMMSAPLGTDPAATAELADLSEDGLTTTINLATYRLGDATVIGWTMNWGDDSGLDSDVIEHISGDTPWAQHDYATTDPHTITASAILDTLTVPISTTLSTAHTQPVLLAAQNLSITGTLDLANNDLVIDYTGASPLSTIRQYLLNGRGNSDAFGATWTGSSGITSSTAANGDPVFTEAIGYAENSDLFFGSFSTFDGQTVDSSSILIRYTRGADANLDGTVDGTDLGLLSNNYGSPGGWYQADFNYDGNVDGSDLDELASTYDWTAPPLTPGPSDARPLVPMGDTLAADDVDLTVAPTNAPSDLAATTFSSTGIGLSWTDNSNNETAFDIERRTDGSSTWEPVGTAPTNATTFFDGTASPDTTYDYRAFARNQNGSSSASAAASGVTAPASRPDPGTYSTANEEDNTPDITGVWSPDATTALHNGESLTLTVSGFGPHTHLILTGEGYYFNSSHSLGNNHVGQFTFTATAAGQTAADVELTQPSLDGFAFGFGDPIRHRTGDVTYTFTASGMDPTDACRINWVKVEAFRPTVTISAFKGEAMEVDDPLLKFKVTRDGVPNSDLTDDDLIVGIGVNSNYDPTIIYATNGEDFEKLPNSVTISAGAVDSEPIETSVIDDTIAEGDEFVKVGIAVPADAVYNADSGSQASAIIHDDVIVRSIKISVDGPPTVPAPKHDFSMYDFWAKYTFTGEGLNRARFTQLIKTKITLVDKFTGNYITSPDEIVAMIGGDKTIVNTADYVQDTGAQLQPFHKTDNVGGVAWAWDNHLFPSRISNELYNGRNVRTTNIAIDVNNMWIKTYDPAKQKWLKDTKWHYTWSNQNHDWRNTDDPQFWGVVCAVELNATDKGWFNDIGNISGLDGLN
jgi:hypothetical protein